MVQGASTGRIWWLASYPKSGNTWLRALLASLISGMPVDINDMSVLGGPIASARALIDDALGIESADLSEEQQTALRPQAYGVVSSQTTEALYLKVHDAYGEPMFPASATAGAIYIVRNPLDVAVSLAHYSNISVKKAVRAVLRLDACFGKHMGTQFPQYLGNWAAHVDGWLAAPFPVHLVRYEDLLDDAETTLAGVVHFLNRRDSLLEIRRALRDCGFANLSSQEEQTGYRANSRSGNKFFRRGVAGAWRDELPAEEAARIVNAFAPTMQRLGY